MLSLANNRSCQQNRTTWKNFPAQPRDSQAGQAISGENRSIGEALRYDKVSLSDATSLNAGDKDDAFPT